MEQWPEMKSFVVVAPSAVAAPLPGFNSSSGEEDQPLGESSSGEDPEDQSSKDSSDEDGPPPDDDRTTRTTHNRATGQWRKRRKRYPRRQPVHADVFAGVVVVLANEAGGNDGCGVSLSKCPLIHRHCDNSVCSFFFYA